MVDKLIVGLTGSQGFIGREMRAQLLGLGHAVVSYNADLRDWDALSGEISNLPAPDAVIHLAGRFTGTAKEIFDSNQLTTWNVLDLLSKRSCRRVLFASTGAVYGNTGSVPIDEDQVCLANNAYGLSKLFGERVVDYYVRENGWSPVVFRVPSVYGANGTKGVLNKWLNQSKQNGTINIEGDGSDVRSFIHVSDVCSAFLLALKSGLTGTFNLSSHEIHDMNSLAALICSRVSVSVNRVKSENKLKSMVLSPNRLISETEWKPRIEIAKHIEREVTKN